MNWLRFALIGVVSWAAAAQAEKASDLNQRGVEAAQHENFVQAQDLYEQAAAEWRALGPEYGAQLGATLLNLGQALNGQGKRPEALKVFRNALDQLRRSAGPADIRTLTTMNYLAAAYMLVGDVDDAKALLEEALPLLRAHHPNDGELSRTLAGLSTVRMWERHVPEANALAEEALSVTLKAEGENSTDAALMYATVGETHRAAGRPERADPLFRKSIAIYSRLLGPDHRRVVGVRCQEALALMQQGKLGMAEHELRSAMDSLSKTCPSCYAERWTAETNLGLVRFRQGKFHEADGLVADALALQERYSTRPGPEMADTLQLLAAVREKERMFDDAARLKQRAATILSYR